MVNSTACLVVPRCLDGDGPEAPGGGARGRPRRALSCALVPSIDRNVVWKVIQCVRRADAGSQAPHAVPAVPPLPAAPCRAWLF